MTTASGLFFFPGSLRRRTIWMAWAACGRRARGHGGDLQGAALITAVASLTGVTRDRDLAPGQRGELGVQARLVALDGEQVMRATAGQVRGVATLSMHLTDFAVSMKDRRSPPMQSL